MWIAVDFCFGCFCKETRVSFNRFGQGSVFSFVERAVSRKSASFLSTNNCKSLRLKIPSNFVEWRWSFKIPVLIDVFYRRIWKVMCQLSFAWEPRCSARPDVAKIVGSDRLFSCVCVLCVCVCVRACVCMRACACVCVCMTKREVGLFSCGVKHLDVQCSEIASFPSLPNGTQWSRGWVTLSQTQR